MKPLELRLALIDLEAAIIRLPVDQSVTVAMYRDRVRQRLQEFKNTHAPVDPEDWTEPPLPAMGARALFLSLGVVLLWLHLGFVTAVGILCLSLAGMVRDDE